MAQKDPTAVASRWAAGLSGAGQAITDGVNSVSQAPGQAAAAQKTAYLANIQASADKWARNTASVTVDEWRQAMITKGVPRIAQGAQAAQPKFAQFMGKLLPYVEAGVRQLPARGTFEQNLNRMTAWARYMKQFSAR